MLKPLFFAYLKLFPEATAIVEEQQENNNKEKDFTVIIQKSVKAS